jgi:PadR family transcriptional regulator PadR
LIHIRFAGPSHSPARDRPGGLSYNKILDISKACPHTPIKNLLEAGKMAKKEERSSGELVQGTLDMLVLKTLTRGAMHGYGIAQSIQQVSDEVLRVEEGSLYPALHRLEVDGVIASEWGQSENNRRAKFYRLTALGRKQLTKESEKWERLAGAIARVMICDAGPWPAK